MSANFKISIERDVEYVWKNISSLGFFAKLFTGVSEVESIKGYKTNERLQISGYIAESLFSSRVSVEFIDSEEKKVIYKSGQTVYEIEINKSGDNTLLLLTMNSQMQDDFLLEIYARSLAKKIKGILEGV